MEVAQERSVSAEGVALLASAVADVYSVQHRSVVETLEAGMRHRQPWDKTAAYTGTPGDPHGRGHRRAYLWATANFPKRMGRRIHNAPAWLFFDEQKVPRSIKSGDEVAIHLKVPMCELLIMQYTGGPRLSWERVLSNQSCCEHEGACCSAVCYPTRKALRTSWDRLFTLSGSPADWQAIVDRIEPEWLHCRLACKPGT